MHTYCSTYDRSKKLFLQRKRRKRTILSRCFIPRLFIKSSYSRSSVSLFFFKCKGRIKSRFMSLIFKLIVVRCLCVCMCACAFISLYSLLHSFYFTANDRRYRKICCFINKQFAAICCCCCLAFVFEFTSTSLCDVK